MKAKAFLFLGCVAGLSGALAANDWDNGGLVQVTADGCRIENCTFANCEIALQGGALYVNGNDCTVTGCTITNCHAVGTNDKRLGGGIYVDYQKDATFVVSNTVFVDCSAFSGGGIWFFDHVIGNQWTDYHPRSDYALVSGCTFRGCRNSYTTASNPRGGAIYGRCWLENSVLTANGGDDGSRCYGAALALGVYSVVRNCIFEFHQTGTLGLVQRTPNNAYPYQVVDSVFRGNSILLIGENAAIDRCTFDGNSLNGNFAQNAPTALRNSLFVRNLQPMRFGSATVEACTFADNLAGGVENSASPSYVNTVLANGATGLDVFPNGAALNLRLDHCWLESKDGDPKFVNKVNGDFHLKRRSPCRDAGLTLDWMTAEAIDLDGKPRRIGPDGKARSDSLPDIGCYECGIPKAGIVMVVR